MPRLAEVPAKPARRAANVTLPVALLADAKAAGLNLSRACERGVAAELAELRRARWLEENREAIEGWNAYVAEHGLPLAKYRSF